MKRLRERQVVWLCAAHRDGPSRQCAVVAVYRATAVLSPLSDPFNDRNGAPTDYYLVFDHDEQPIALRGAIGITGDDLRFHATDGVVVSEDAAPRVARELPIELIATNRAYAAPIQGVTASYSADGAVLKEAGDLEPGEAVMFTFAPRTELQISGRGEVLQMGAERLGVAFSGLDPTLRARVVEDVIDAKRSELART